MKGIFDYQNKMSLYISLQYACNTTIPFFSSKVTEENEQRHAAIKDAIQADTGRKLSPETIPIAHTPILLNPVEGNILEHSCTVWNILTNIRFLLTPI